MVLAKRIPSVMSSYLLDACGLKRNPFKFILINPAEVQYCTHHITGITFTRNTSNSPHCSELPRGYFPSSAIGSIKNGDWDLPVIKICEMPEYLALESVVKHGSTWLETAFSKRIESLIESGFTLYGCKTVDEYREMRPVKIQSLIDSIKESGYVPACTNPFYASYYDNAQVNQGRDGRYLFNGAFHRFCISRILGIKLIPVIVVVKHENLTV